MEFHKKLQEIRKQKGLTQEELAKALYVSRTAISKWESDRGYPNIESLKAIAKFFSVTVDELLTGDEILEIADEDSRQQSLHICDLVFGLIDCSYLLLLFLPMFGQEADGFVQSVSLVSLSYVSPYLKALFILFVAVMSVIGIAILALQRLESSLWNKTKSRLSLFLNSAMLFVFILSRQPYAAVFSLSFLMIKIFVLSKPR